MTPAAGRRPDSSLPRHAAFLVLAFAVVTAQVRLGMYDMPTERFLDVLPYVVYLFAGPLLAGRIARTLWKAQEADWSLELLYCWVFGVIVEATLWTAAFATGYAPYLLYATFLAVSLAALGSRRLELLSWPRFTRSDLAGIAASFL